MSRGRANGDESVHPFVDGVSWRSESEATIDGIDPSNGQRCTVLPAGCEEDVNRAVASARRTFELGTWSEEAPSVRKRVLQRFADLIYRDGASLDALDAREMGKPVREPLANAAAAAGLVRFYAEAVDKVTGEVYASDRNSLVAQRWVPRGVVGAIVPWNFPTYVAALKIAPALAAGNSVVLKPSELSTRSAIKLAQLAVEAGIPAGILNVVPGLGTTVGRALALHMGVDMVSFTGSTDVGKQLFQYAGQSNLKVVVAECGGKSPQIVFDDGVDLDGASESIAKFILTNQGQICSVGSRVLVQRSIEREVTDRIAARMQKIVMGNALDSNTTFGPIASRRQCERVLEYIRVAQADGAQLVTGGERALEGSGGFFVTPTLFRNVLPEARVAREEIFGPVLSIIVFDDAAEAIRIANGTDYGLAAYVWTASLSTGMKMMKGIRSSVRINAVALPAEGAGHAASAEPAGESGVGTEGGLGGLQAHLRRQRVWFTHA
jgi:acyl-CoA reductase-like NAD-dependent aldehyde dehydrogenase